MSATIGITVQHPAHVHFFRHAIDELQRRGHDVHVFARAKDVAVDLLEAYDLDYRLLADEPASTIGLAGVQAAYEYRLWRAARRIDPDVLTAVGGVAVSHVARLVDATSVLFVDNEDVAANYLSIPFADVVCTPQGYRGDLGEKHRRYDGFHELAYLHPDRFEPRPDLLRHYGVDPESFFSVVRFVGWDAHHDVGQAGFSRAGKRRLVERLAAEGDVYVSAEGSLPTEFDAYDIPVPPEHLHQLLAAANCYVGDSQTMATEAGLLGTPAVRSNSFADSEDMSNFVELEAAGLVRSIGDERRAIETVDDLCTNPGRRREWDNRREALLSEKVDVTEFVVETVLEAAGEPVEGRPTVEP